jgi:hypothetical protein
MRDPHQLDDKEYLAMAEILEVLCEAEHLLGMDWYDPTCYAPEILDPKYEKVSTNDVVNSLTPMVAYMRPFFLQALFKLNIFFNFCPLTTFDSSKCVCALPLQ